MIDISLRQNEMVDCEVMVDGRWDRYGDMMVDGERRDDDKSISGPRCDIKNMKYELWNRR